MALKKRKVSSKLKSKNISRKGTVKKRLNGFQQRLREQRVRESRGQEFRPAEKPLCRRNPPLPFSKSWKLKCTRNLILPWAIRKTTLKLLDEDG